MFSLPPAPNPFSHGKTTCPRHSAEHARVDEPTPPIVQVAELVPTADRYLGRGCFPVPVGLNLPPINRDCGEVNTSLRPEPGRSDHVP